MGNPVISSDASRELVVLKHAVENTNEAFVTIDKDHRVLFFNKAAERIFGYTRDEVLGHDLNVIMAPTCSQNHREAVARYLRTREPRRIGHETEITATRGSGETFPAAISFSVAEVDGELFFTGIVRDMTETHALQEKLLLGERLAALGHLVAEISHEIKNPLMMIGGFATQLARSEPEEGKRAKLEIIIDEVKRLENLLGDLREYHGRRPLEAGPLDLRKQLEEVVSIVKENNVGRDLTIEIQDDSSGRPILADKERVRQVLLNLVKNAGEAVQNGGHILTRIAEQDGSVMVDIQDDGCGISETNKQKIFSPFFSTKKSGTGLGLCISKRIVDEHEGGGFEIESEEGKGTTIHLRFPLYDPLGRSEDKSASGARPESRSSRP